jgi:transposase
VQRSTKLSLKFANKVHQDKLRLFVAEYRRVAVLACQKLWDENWSYKFVNTKTLGIETWLSARALQACSKQVMSVITGTRKSRKTLKSTATSAPDCSRIEPCLDSRFLTWDNEPNNSFDLWLNLGSLGNKLKLRVPLKSTRHQLKLAKEGKLQGSINVSSKSITLVYRLPDPEPAQGSTLGIDVGIAELASPSHNRKEIVHPHGWTMSKICSRLASKKKGSVNFRQAQTLRDNFIGWYVNQLNLSGVSQVKLENIHDLRRYKKVDRFRSHWPYPKIFRKLESRCQQLGVQVAYINQRNTSRCCSACGTVDAASRVNKVFECTSCGTKLNADFNAALNIERQPVIGLARGAYSPSLNRNALATSA